MKKRKWEQGFDGVRITPRMRNYRVRCCDCGLVHVINYRIKDGKLSYIARRDARSTAAWRRERAKPKRIW